MPSALISPQLVIGIQQGKSSDPESFALLLKALQSQRYRISAEQSHLYDLLPTWEKSSWRPSVKTISGIFWNGSYKLGASSVVHEGMHALAAAKYGSQLGGRPRFVLLVEALASCSNVYFDLNYVARQPKSRRAAHLVRHYCDYGKRAKVPGLDRLHQALADPFACFRRSVTDMFEIYSYMLEQERNGYSEAKKTCAFLMKRRNLMFLLPFDLGNNVLFAKANCGLKSSTQDRKICAEILRHLERSPSMHEFLLTLSL